MDNLTIVSQSTFSGKPLEVAKIIARINFVKSYPLTDQEIEKWAIEICTQKPDLNLDNLRKAMDNLILGKWDYNPHIGIANIFQGLYKLENTMVY